MNEFVNLEHGTKFRFKDHKYLVTPYLDTHPRIVEKKAAQLGLTTKAIMKSIHGCINRFPLGVIYFFPSDTDVSDFSRGRAKPLIENNPDTIKCFCRDTDSVGIRAIGKSVIYFRGMRSAVAVKSVPADMLVFDEFDEANPNSIEMARQRTAHSEFKEEIALSNPTIPGYGIDAEFMNSDQRYWLIRCGCGKWNNVVETFPDCVVNNKLVCTKCGKELDRNAGEWVAKAPTVTYTHGYQYSQLIAPMTDIERLWRQYKDAQLKGRLQTFYNLVLGLAYVSAKEKLTKEQVLELCDVKFPADPFSGDEPICMGVDQGRDLHIVFKKRVGDKVLTWFAVERDFESMDTYMDRVERCVIDALPETRKAREFAERWQGKVFLNFYVETQKGATKWNEDDMIVQENRTESMDASHSMFYEKVNVLPARGPEVEEFAEHCSNVAKKLMTDDETGSKRYVWIKIGDDHFRHADNYATIALQECSGYVGGGNGELNYV